MSFKKIVPTSLALLLTVASITGCSTKSNKTSYAASTKYGAYIETESVRKEVDLARALYKHEEEKDMPENDLEDSIDTTIDYLVELEVLYQEGLKSKLEATETEIETEVDEKINYMVSNYSLSEDEINNLLDSVGYDEEYLNKTAEKTIISRKYFEHIYNDLSVSVNDVEEYYDENKDELYSYSFTNTAHILISTVDKEGNTLSDKKLKAAKEKANEVLEKIKAGEDFAELARKYSDDEATKESGGELGSFSQGELVAEYENAAFSLEKGKITEELVETSYGYHIIKLNDKGIEYQTFEDIEANVRYDLLLDSTYKKIDTLKEENSTVYKDFSDSFIKTLEPVKYSLIQSEETTTKDTTKVDENKKDTTKDTTKVDENKKDTAKDSTKVDENKKDTAKDSTKAEENKKDSAKTE